jgi:ABC-type branched-subunit amino acid transport system substrate-binding protein
MISLARPKPGRSRWLGRRLPVAIPAVALALGLAACSSSSAASPSAGAGSTTGGSTTGTSASGQCSNIPAGPIKMANIVPLSGPTAIDGQLIEDASSVEQSYFNAHDSICGHQIQISNYNDKGDPATSLSIARQLSSQGETIVLQDSYSSPQNQIQPYLMQQHMLVVNNDGAYALFNAAQNPEAFSVGPSNAQYASEMVDYAKAHGYNDVGILSDGTSFAVELAADTQADLKAAGLKLVTTITYSPTAIDLTTPLTQAKDAGVQTLMTVGFTGVPAMVSGIKQLGWAPHIVSWGGLHTYGITASQVPPGTVDGCYFSYTPGKPTSTLLTPENTALLKGMAAKIGTNPETAEVLELYPALLAVKHAIETANSLDGAKLATVLDGTSSLVTNLPGIDMTFTATPTVHNGWPNSAMKECTLTQGPYDILYAAS